MQGVIEWAPRLGMVAGRQFSCIMIFSSEPCRCSPHDCREIQFLYFVSLDPEIRADENIPPFSPMDDPSLRTLLENAVGVILPVYLSPWRYRTITRHARDWFPRLDARFLYRGKGAQIGLFRRMGVRHPESLVFPSPEALLGAFRSGLVNWDHPYVLKGDSGGGGSAVFPVHGDEDLQHHAGRLRQDEPALVQRWVHHGGRDLRVVVYGPRAVSYFRVGDGSFYNNVCRGGRLDHDSEPEIQAQGCRAVLDLSRRAGIDVAGFDLMFPDEGAPVFIEINFHFGRKGLGGSRGHRGHMRQAVEDWRCRKLAAPGVCP